MFSLDLSNRFKKTYKKLESTEQTAIQKALRILAENPRHPLLRVKKVKGHESVFEASATMEIRITFTFETQDVLRIRNCGHHDKTLSNP